MSEYCKINTIWKRDQKGRIIEGDYSCPEFEYLANNLWIFTEKVDGTNVRIMWDGKSVTFGGRTDAAQMPTTLLNRLAQIFPGPDKFKEKFGEHPATLYGEGYGAKIQKCGGNYKADGQDFVLFDVRIGHWWLERLNIEEIASFFGLMIVPIMGIGKLADAIVMVRDGLTSKWGNFESEGIVARPRIELKARSGERIIAKIKSRDYK